MTSAEGSAFEVREAIRQSGRSIYDSLADRPELVLSIDEIETLLRHEIIGQVIPGAVKTRAKLAKERVTEALGYPVPSSFKSVRPRLQNQRLEVAVQLSDNLQIWNQAEIEPTHRFALLRPDRDARIVAVKVLSGDAIAALDRTGKLTSKFQASRKTGQAGSILVSFADTARMSRLLAPIDGGTGQMTSEPPVEGGVIPVVEVFNRLSQIVGMTIPDPGVLQDRQRGESVQQLVAAALRSGPYRNFGQWPDIRSQAIEVKLQLAHTVDLGLVLPSSEAAAEDLGHDLRHCDVRYAVFYAERVSETEIQIVSLVLSTGRDFFDEFMQFGGNISNSKLQMPLPRDLFEPE